MRKNKTKKIAEKEERSRPKIKRNWEREKKRVYHSDMCQHVGSTSSVKIEFFSLLDENYTRIFEPNAYVIELRKIGPILVRHFKHLFFSF